MSESVAIVFGSVSTVLIRLHCANCYQANCLKESFLTISGPAEAKLHWSGIARAKRRGQNDVT